jgi:hypothetical protein
MRGSETGSAVVEEWLEIAPHGRGSWRRFEARLGRHGNCPGERVARDAGLHLAGVPPRCAGGGIRTAVSADSTDRNAQIDSWRLRTASTRSISARRLVHLALADLSTMDRGRPSGGTGRCRLPRVLVAGGSGLIMAARARRDGQFSGAPRATHGGSCEEAALPEWAAQPTARAEVNVSWLSRRPRAALAIAAAVVASAAFAASATHS